MTDTNFTIGKRVDIDGSKATIRYAGPLIHEVTGVLAKKKDELWYGIEWDHADRGKNNGIIGGIEYFKVKNLKVKSGSLALEGKCHKGMDILEAIVVRYFKPNEIREILECKENIVEVLQAKALSLKNQTIDQINTEFDEEGFIYTFKTRTKKIEFMGFDKHWQRINQ